MANKSAMDIFKNSLSKSPLSSWFSSYAQTKEKQALNKKVAERILNANSKKKEDPQPDTSKGQPFKNKIAKPKTQVDKPTSIKASNIKKPVMITGYDKSGKAVQVEKGKYVPGISLTKPTAPFAGEKSQEEVKKEAATNPFAWEKSQEQIKKEAKDGKGGCGMKKDGKGGSMKVGTVKNALKSGVKTGVESMNPISRLGEAYKNILSKIRK